MQRKSSFCRLVAYKLSMCILGLLTTCLLGNEIPGTERERELIIVQLSDLHYTSNPPRKTTFSWRHHIRIFGYKLHKKNMANCRQILHDAVSHINEHVKPDLVVITGDLVDRGNDLGGMKEVKSILERLNCPYYPVMGDHDFCSAEDNRANYRKIFGDVNYAVEHGGCRLVVLGVQPEEKDLEWLRNEIAQHSSRPTIIFTHRMIKSSPLLRFLARRYYSAEVMAPQAKRIAGIISESGNVIAVVSGHSHMNYEVLNAGTLYVSTASLIEPPYHFRVLTVSEKGLSTKVKTVRFREAR